MTKRNVLLVLALVACVAVRLTASEKTELERRANAERLTVSRYIHRILFG